MPFGTGTVVTNKGKAIFAGRVQTTAPSAGATTPYVAGSTPPKFASMGVGATAGTHTAAAADIALCNEVEARVSGAETIVTITNTGDTYQVVATITATAVEVIDEAGLWDQITTTTATVQANASAVSITIASNVSFPANGANTFYATNRTTPTSSPQTIACSASTGTTMTVTALTGQINVGDRITFGNLFTSATFPVISLAIGDSIQFTWQVKQS